jgi:hypothetical protein
MARRFQVVKVEEPDEEKAMVMMRAIGPFLEKHHNVMITDAALADTVHLSSRYISGRQLPDKAVSVLDTACARVAIGLTTSPPPWSRPSGESGTSTGRPNGWSGRRPSAGTTMNASGRTGRSTRSHAGRNGQAAGEMAK